MVNYPTTPKHSVLVEDVSDALVLTGTQTIKYLYKITSPNGTIIYKNAGYDTDTYTTSDKGTSVTYNLPLTTSGEPEAGAYIIYVKAQFADSAFPLTDFTTSKTTTTSELCMCDVKTISINLSYDVLGNPSTFTSTDTTDYSGSLDYYSLSRTHTVRPPLASGLSNLVGSSTTLVYSSIWTGSWESMVQSYVTYRGFNSNDSTYSYFTYYCVGSDSEIVVSDSVLCKMYCGLKSLESKVASSSGRTKDDYEKKFSLGSNEMLLAIQSGACNDSEKLTYFSDRFYVVTGLDPNCDCCGEGDGSAPIINTSTTSTYNLSIGSITTNVTPSASITGTYPNQQLNIVFPVNYNLAIGSITTGGIGSASLTGTYPNKLLNIVFPSSVITPESYILDETVVNASSTNLQLFNTGGAGHYAIKEQNQIWKQVMSAGSVPNIAIDTERFDVGEGVPVFEPSATGTMRLRKIHDGRLHIKGYFNIIADTGVEQKIFKIPSSICPPISLVYNVVRGVLTHFLCDNFPGSANDTMPSASYGNSNVFIKKAVGDADFYLVFRDPSNIVAAPVGGFYVWVDEILDLTENIFIR